MENRNRKIIVGNGWAALASIAFELASGEAELIWVLGSGTRLHPVLPTLPRGRSLECLRELMKLCGTELEPSSQDADQSSDQFVSEYRNKSLRPPSWEDLPDELWGAERYLVASEETDLGISLDRADQILRERVEMQVGARIRRIEECALREMNSSTSGVSLVLASGETIEAEECIYADRWNDLRPLKGAPRRAQSRDREVKLSEILRHSDPTGMIQVTFSHNVPLDVEEQHGMFAVTHRESGESFDRRVWGYFLDRRTSRWSLALTHEEGEDNHLIAKKIRRIKQTLTRMAADLRWCPEDVKEFSDTIESEHVRLEEGVLFSEGEIIRTPLRSGKHLKLIGDSFGIGAALEQVAGLYLDETESQDIHPVSVGATHQPDALI